MTTPESIWDSRYKSLGPAGIRYDPWLNRWTHLFTDAVHEALDIGCGPGMDTEVLGSIGFKVTSIDFSAEALKLSAVRSPRALHLQRDISNGIGTFESKFTLTLANLSLHYFTEAQTEQIVGEIRDVLMEDGLFALRVNSSDDVNYGAPAEGSDWELESVNGVSKQFFSEQMLCEVLKDKFDIINMEAMKTTRFGKPKQLIECISRKSSSNKSA